MENCKFVLVFNSYLHRCLMLCSYMVPGDWCLDIGRRCCWVETQDPRGKCGSLLSLTVNGQKCGQRKNMGQSSTHQSTRLWPCTRVRPLYLKKGCVHVSAQYSGTVLGHEVWSQPKAWVWEPYYDCTYKKQWTITSIRSVQHLSRSEISAQHSLQIHRRKIHA